MAPIEHDSDDDVGGGWDMDARSASRFAFIFVRLFHFVY